MAKSVQLKQKNSGVMKTGYYGFSWTTLFFGGFPALFRGDFLTFIGIFAVLFLVGFVTFGVGAFIAMFVWAFFYNGYYTKKLLEKGYAFSDFQHINEEAARSLGVSIPIEQKNNEEVQSTRRTTQTAPTPRTPTFKVEDKILSNDAYKIYLVKKYPLEFNEVLKKYIFKDRLFDTVDEALIAVHEVEVASEKSAPQSGISQRGFTDINEAISFLGFRGISVQTAHDGKITVVENNSTQYFYHGAAFLDYANRKVNGDDSSN